MGFLNWLISILTRNSRHKKRAPERHVHINCFNPLTSEISKFQLNSNTATYSELENFCFNIEFIKNVYCLYFCSFSIEIVWHMSPLLLLITCYVSENSQFGIWNLSPALIIHFILTNRSIGKNDNTPCQNITCMRLWRDFYGVLFDTSKIQFSQKWNERRSKSFEYFKYFQFLNYFRKFWNLKKSLWWTILVYWWLERGSWSSFLPYRNYLCKNPR